MLHSSLSYRLCSRLAVLSLAAPSIGRVHSRVAGKIVALTPSPAAQAQNPWLSAAVEQASPWLRTAAFDSEQLGELARQVQAVPLARLALVKAFTPRNDAEIYASLRPTVQWACSCESCATIVRGGRCGADNGAEATLGDALAHGGAPVSARVATAATAYAAAPALARWLETLDDATERPFRDADVYMTAPPSSSASLGWHIDDVDVLLVMLRGRKRFRVAGTALGSRVTIDHELKPGDAIYIPALTFHTGGSNDPETEQGSEQGSLMLSVAYQPRVGAGPAEAVREWREARRALLARLPPNGNHWAWAGTADGRRMIGRTLRLNPAWTAFLPDNKAGGN